MVPAGWSGHPAGGTGEMKKPLYPVSDHAVLRWLERVRGIDVETARREIGHLAAIALDHPGAGAVLVDGIKLQLRDGVVITVVEKLQGHAAAQGRPGGRGVIRPCDHVFGWAC